MHFENTPPLKEVTTGPQGRLLPLLNGADPWLSRSCEFANLKKYFPIRGGLLSREVARVHAVDDVSFDIHAGRDARAGRRVGLRQVDDRPHASCA